MFETNPTSAAFASAPAHNAGIASRTESARFRAWMIRCMLDLLAMGGEPFEAGLGFEHSDDASEPVGGGVVDPRPGTISGRFLRDGQRKMIAGVGRFLSNGRSELRHRR